jgi:hypothetical protein
MAVTSFKRNVWAANLLTALKKSLVSEFFVNHDYQGYVPGAKSVTINTLSDITVKDYDGSDITFDDLSTTDQTLLLDFMKDFAFQVKDVDKVQVASGGELMATATQNAAYRIAESIDKKNFDTLTLGAGVVIETDDAPRVIQTAEDAKAALLDVIEQANAANVPEVGRVVAIPNRFERLLLSDKYLGLALPTGEDVLRRGYIGHLFGVELYRTNQLQTRKNSSDADVTDIILSHPKFMTEAIQLEELEAGRREANFSDFVKGLFVSGRKVIMPQGVIRMVVNFQ